MAMNQVCHIEWHVTDLAGAQAFYGGLFGWSFRSFGDEMVVFGVGSEHIGGFTKAEKVVPGNSPSVWFEVDDLDAYLTKATGLGGSVGAEKHPVPGVGWSGIVKDPEGNNIGLVQFDRK